MKANATSVREPWPDEVSRVQHFLQSGFLYDPEPYLLIAVTGRVERIAGALALSSRALASIESSWMNTRTTHEDESITADLVKRALDEAWKRESRSVILGQTLREGSPAEQSFRGLGFVPAATHEVYELDAAPLFERIERVYKRLRTRGMIPENAELMSLQQTLIPKVRKFLQETVPGSATTLANNTIGYKSQHSLVLLLGDEVKGVILGRRAGNTGNTGLRAVAKELQGGFGWANIFLMYGSLASGMQTGLERVRFELDPQAHHDTSQFAQIQGGRLVSRRVMLKIDNPNSIRGKN